MKKAVEILMYLLSALFAYFFPEYQGQLPEAFTTFGAFAFLVLFLAAKLNTWQQWQGLKAWSAAGVIGIVAAYAGYFLKLGMLAEALWWHPIIYGVGSFAAATALFGIPAIEDFLKWLFDYSWKKKIA